MKLCTMLLLFYLTGYAALPQNQKLDSLNRLISQATSDTARINLENKRNMLVSRVNIDTGILLNKKAIAGSRAINYKAGEASARVSLASNYCMKGSFSLAADNLLISKNISLSLKDSGGLCSAYSGYGMMYGMQSKYDTSIQYFEKAISIAERNNLKDKLPIYYGNIAVDYQQQSNFLKALSYQQKALDLAKEKNDISGQAYTNLNMGLTYSNMNDTMRAQRYLLEAVRLAKTENIKNVELYGYSNIANIYSKKKEPQKAYDFAMRAAVLGKAMGDYGIQSASLAKAAESLNDLKKFDEAEALAKRAISIADSSGQTYNIYQTNATMGAVLKVQEKYKQAIPFLEKSISILEQTDLYNEEVKVSHADLSLCYEKTGNFGKALALFKKATAISDSILSRDNIRKATELGMTYEFDKKQEAQRIAQENKDAVVQARQTALAIGLGLTIIAVIVALRANRHKQKANYQLELQKKEIESTLTKLKSAQAQLVQAEKMASLGELTAGIAHEIQNPLNFVNNFSEINTELIEELVQEASAGNMDEVRAIANDIRDNEQKINHHGKRADSIVKGMLQHSRASSGKKEPADINVIADEYLRLSYHGLRAKDKTFNAGFTTHFDNSIEKINIIHQDIGRVLLNLFNNAFYAVAEKKKSAGPGYDPMIEVSTKALPGKVEIIVSDNGNGIPQKVLDKIFQPFFTTKPSGQGTGLGLSLSYDIIKAHGGEITAKTTEGIGTEFIIHLPFAQTM